MFTEFSDVQTIPFCTLAECAQDTSLQLALSHASKQSLASNVSGYGSDVAKRPSSQASDFQSSKPPTGS